MTYSVWSGAPPIFLNSGLPKPTENRSTLKPSLRATQKWPNSCTVTSRLTPTMNHNAFQPNSKAGPLGVHSTWPDERESAGACFGVGRQHVIEIADFPT